MTTLELASALSAISSGDPVMLMQAEQKINAWQMQPGFYTELARVFSDWSSFDGGVRLQAVLLCKNAVDRRWRRLAPNALSESDKSCVREALVRCLDEPLDNLALQESVLMGKVARLDVPKDWPDLMSGLVNAVINNLDKNEFTEEKRRLRQRRSLLFLYSATKALSSKRLATDRRVFHEITNQLLLPLLNLWSEHHNVFVQFVRDDGKIGEALYSLSLSHLVLKLLRKCIVHGLTKCHENEAAMQFLSHLLTQIKICVAMREEKMNTLQSLIPPLEKYSVLQLKILKDILDVQPQSFIPMIQPTLSTIYELVLDNTDKVLFDRFIVFSLNIVKMTLDCPEYKTPRSANVSASALAVARASNGGFSAKQSFFTESVLRQTLLMTVLKYLQMRPQDLAQWDEDPEAFFTDDGSGDSWRYSYRPCVELFFISLFKQFRAALVPMLIELLKHHSQPIDPTDLKAVLTKDAVYNAVGLVAFDLYDEIDFDSWLISGLESELKVNASNYRLVRRRAAWLLGQWSGVKLSPALRPKLYDMLLPLLSSSEDLAVRLAAANALKVVVDDFEFRAKEIEPFISTLFSNLIALLKEVNEAETKLSVLNVLSYLIERMGPSISAHINELVLHLPHLWNASEEHNLLRCSIISATAFVLHSLGPNSEQLLSFVVPLVHFSTDINEASSVYMMEDGLDLWLAALHNSKQLTPEIADLAKKLPGLIEMGTEHLENVLYIIQAYMFMAPAEVIAAHGEAIALSLTSLYSDLNDDGVTTILRLQELVLRLGPPLTAQIFQPLITAVLKDMCTKEGRGHELRLHSNVFSRLVLTNLDSLSSIVASIPVENGDRNLLDHLLDIWLSHVVHQHEHEKLQALAGCQLLSHIQNELVRKRVFKLISLVTEALNDVTVQDDPQSTYRDMLVKTEADLQAERDDPDYLSQHELRRLAFAAMDPIHSVDLIQCFQKTVSSLKSQMGPQMFQELVSQIDVETLANMKTFVTL